MIRNKIIPVLNVISITCLLLDSGGGLGLRNVAFTLILIFGCYGIYRNASINKLFLTFYLLFIILLIPPLIVSLINNVPMNKAFIWVVSFFLLPFFYFYVKGCALSNNAFVTSGLIFSIIIIMIFSGRLFNIALINNIADYIKDHSEGFFGDKSYLSGDVLPNVYFQGTLGLIICGSLSLQGKKYLTYFLIIIALILAPSRFGFLVLLSWGTYIFICKSIINLIVLPALIVTFLYTLSHFPFGVEMFSIFTGGGNGLEIRNGHLESVYNSFIQTPESFFWGAGPGSVFYSKGAGNVIDNIEMSQLEYIRKFGIFSFLAFNVLYFGPFFSRAKGDFYILGALCMYYFVAFSNPVLYSIFAMLFLAYAYVECFQHKTQQINKPLITNGK
ncbi:MAG: hypothetical protein JWP81_4138 [Ferruginibacter sp.]|nr:hypothetical protein [Ferruginibacter sp.]